MKIIPGPHNSARALVLPNSLNPSQPYDQDSLNSLNITHYSGPCRIKLKFPTSVLTYSSFQCPISSPITLMPFVEFFFLITLPRSFGDKWKVKKILKTKINITHYTHKTNTYFLFLLNWLHCMYTVSHCFLIQSSDILKFILLLSLRHKSFLHSHFLKCSYASAELTHIPHFFKICLKAYFFSKGSFIYLLSIFWYTFWCIHSTNLVAFH